MSEAPMRSMFITSVNLQQLLVVVHCWNVKRCYQYISISIHLYIVWCLFVCLAICVLSYNRLLKVLNVVNTGFTTTQWIAFLIWTRTSFFFPHLHLLCLSSNNISYTYHPFHSKLCQTTFSLSWSFSFQSSPLCFFSSESLKTSKL